MGWTGKTFRDYRCWYIAVFPPSLLIIVSIVVLLVIIVVCVLYIIILHSAVKTVDKIREFKESNSIAFVNRAFEDDCGQISKTTVTITVSTVTQEAGTSMEMRNTSKTNIEQKRTKSKLKEKISNISRSYCKAKALNSNPSKLKAVKTVLLVTFSFVGTWAPYYVAVIIYVKCDIMVHGYDCIPLEILTLGPLYLLGVCNSLLDPLIYAWRHSGFKSSIRRMYWKYICKIKL